jgi:protein SCO1/2
LVSVDPEHDTLQVLKDYLYNFDKRIIGATGTVEEIETAQKSFRVYASRGSAAKPAANHSEHASHAGQDSSAHMAHSDHLYLLSPAGELLHIFGADSDGQAISQKIKSLL